MSEEQKTITPTPGLVKRRKIVKIPQGFIFPFNVLDTSDLSNLPHGVKRTYIVDKFDAKDLSFFSNTSRRHEAESKDRLHEIKTEKTLECKRLLDQYKNEIQDTKESVDQFITSVLKLKCPTEFDRVRFMDNIMKHLSFYGYLSEQDAFQQLATFSQWNTLLDIFPPGLDDALTGSRLSREQKMELLSTHLDGYISQFMQFDEEDFVETFNMLREYFKDLSDADKSRMKKIAESTAKGVKNNSMFAIKVKKNYDAIVLGFADNFSNDLDFFYD